MPDSPAIGDDDLRAAFAATYLRWWARHVDKSYEHPAHIVKLCETLERVERGEVRRLIVTMPPRHGKSVTATRRFAAWYLGRNPDKRVIIAAHTASLAETFSRSARNELAEHGDAVFGVKISEDSSSVQHWSIAGRRGGLVAAGVGGPLTGQGADCLVGATIIETESGPIELARLVAMQDRPRVLSFDHETGALVWRRVVAARETATDELYEITSGSGVSLRSTGRHRYFVRESGYRQAAVLRPGDGLVRCEVAQQQAVRDLWSGEDGAGRDLSGVLRQEARDDGGVEVCAVWRDGDATPICVREISEARHHSGVLLQDVHGLKSAAQVRDVRQAGGDAHEQVLLSPVLDPKSGVAEQDVFDVRHGVQAARNEDAVLFAQVCEPSAFDSDGGAGQFALQGRNELRQGIREGARCGVEARRIPLSSVWPAGHEALGSLGQANGDALHSGGASLGREPTEQQARQPGDAVRVVPHRAPQVGTDVVISVERVECRRVPVYDLQVEGTANFFANGILVHNCLLLDDVVKDREAAFSQVQREAVWEWYRTVARTRVHPGGAIVLVMTRWHQDDLAGRLLAEAKKGGEQWDQLTLPMVNDATRDILWPERYSPEEVAGIRAAVGSYAWEALYQQRPTSPAGEVFKREWWKFYRAAPELDELLLSADCTFKDLSTSDFVVIQVWGRKGAARYLLDQVRGRMGFGATVQAIRAMAAKWPRATTKLIEDKANGSAVIETLRKEIPGIIAVNPEGGKEARAAAVSPQVEAGNVHLPEAAPWCGDFVEECAAFPRGQHDDQVDAMTQALIRWNRPALVYSVAAGGR